MKLLYIAQQPCQQLIQQLAEQGFELASCEQELALTKLQQQRFDLLLLEFSQLTQGVALCSQLRSLGLDTPLLVVSPQGDITSLSAAFNAGADDFLAHPYDIRELGLRLKALARWRSGQSRQLQVGELQLDLQTRSAQRCGQALKLSPSGLILLEQLMRASPAIVSKEQLAASLWADEQPDSNALKVHLYKLRQQVDKPFKSSLIHTIPGLGVVLRSS